MKVYDGAGSLSEFGIYALTGEACGLAMRILCDLSSEGQQIIREFLRVEPNAEPWNNSTNGHEHIASIMLPYSILEELWLFCHVRRGTKYVFRGGYVNKNEWTETTYNWSDSTSETIKHPVKTWRSQPYAIEDHEQYNRIIEQGFCFHISRYYAKSKQPGTGLDNQHAMSGRTL